MPSGAKNTAETVRELLEPQVNGLGYQIWDVEYVKEGAEYHLRVTIDSPEGINIDDCEKVHRFIDPILDEADPIEASYILEVSSPGIERELRLPRHFEACIGETVTLKLFAPVDGQKKLVGKLLAYDPDNGSITVECGEKTIALPRASVSKANIYYEF